MDTSKLKGKIIEKFGSQKSFADKIGKDGAYVTRILNGTQYLNVEEVYIWASVLDIGVTELYDYFFTRKVDK